MMTFGKWQPLGQVQYQWTLFNIWRRLAANPHCCGFFRSLYRAGKVMVLGGSVPSCPHPDTDAKRILELEWVILDLESRLHELETDCKCGV